jgi:DNA-binding LytR/AlgR family response regulator
MNKLKCMVIDDEPIARKGIEEYIQDVEFLELSGKAENPFKAYSLLKESLTDLIFLDIQMPKMNGMDFIRSLQNPPMIIFTTAYSEYAVDGFALDAIDYLLKPISRDRFMKASYKAYEYHLLKSGIHHSKNYSENNCDHFYVKCGNRIERIVYDSVSHIEALQNYVIIHTNEKKYITYMTFKGIEESLPDGKFARIHKSMIVSIGAIKSIDGNTINLQSIQLQMSRGFKDSAVEKIVGRNMIRR